MANNIVNVDIDIIKQLRLEGRYEDADRLLESHYAIKKNNRRVYYRELLNKEKRKLYYERSKHDCCVYCGVRLERDNSRKACDSCRARKSRYFQNYKNSVLNKLR